MKYGRSYQMIGNEKFVIGVGLYNILKQQTELLNKAFGDKTQFVEEITEQEFYEGVKEMGL